MPSVEKTAVHIFWDIHVGKQHANKVSHFCCCEQLGALNFIDSVVNSMPPISIIQRIACDWENILVLWSISSNATKILTAKFFRCFHYVFQKYYQD